MWKKLKNALIKIWFTEEGYKQFQREMQDIKQGTKPIEHQGKEKKKDEKMEVDALIFSPSDVEKLKAEKDVEGLIKALKDKDQKVREKAAKALGETNDKRAAEPLIQALYDEKNSPSKCDCDVWELATQALRKIKDERAVEILIHDLNSEVRHIKLSAGYTLGRLGDQRAIESLIDAMKEDDKTVRHEIAEGFVFLVDDIGDIAVRPLIQALKDENWGLREEAAWILGTAERKDKRVAEPLIQALKDENKSVRAQAAWALGDVDNARAVDPLAQALKDDDEGVREAAKEALEKIKAEKKKDKKMEYFECDVPSGDGVCSDNNCPCPEVVIPRGTGYLYIDQDLVDFRHKYPIMKSAREAMQRRQDQMRSNSGGMFTGFYRLGPILVCEQGAKLRNLDLGVAAEDAKYWWETGKVPLRATPIKQSTKNKPKKKSTVRRKQKRCAKCGEPLSESIDYNSTSSGTAILGGGQFWEMMSEKFSLAIYCKKCDAYYCAGCALEAWQKGGEERFICPRCGEDLGDASIIL